MVIVFLGPPGSGKGTQAARLKSDHGFLHFDTGAALREAVESGSELGQRIAPILNAGNLVPLDVIRDLILGFVRNASADRILFDGFPRNIDQAMVLDEGLIEMGRKLDAAIYLNLQPEALLNRIVHRRMCEKCGAIYNLETNPAREDAVCDKDGSPLVQREDDTPEVFSQRVKVYLSQTVPVLEHYRGHGVLREVDGADSVDQVTENILKILGLASDQA